MDKVLEILERDSRLTAEQVAEMINAAPAEVAARIAAYEKNGTILGYTTLIDWDKTERELITALIEVKVTPQKGEGYDSIAARVYPYPEVQSVYLMSGGFDLTVIIQGRTLKEVARFVSENLAPLDSVLSTSTHFVLKKYKDKGVVYAPKQRDERRTISL